MSGEYALEIETEDDAIRICNYCNNLGRVSVLRMSTVCTRHGDYILYCDPHCPRNRLTWRERETLRKAGLDD